MKTNFWDSLTNFVANLGTTRDKLAASAYTFTPLTDLDLSNAYRGAWLPRKIIDTPPKDETRNWRAWQGNSQQIERMEAEEKRLGLRAKVRQARTWARLWGGAAIVIGGADDAELMRPLNPARFASSPIPYLLVMTRMQLTAGDVETDPRQPMFGRPKWYIPTGSALRLHPSRVVRFVGNPLAGDDITHSATAYGYGDSILNAVYSALQQADSTVANVASLVFEAKVDVVKMPGFMQKMGDPRQRELILQRMSLAGTAKGINGMLLLDEQEEYQSKSASFGTLDAIIDRMCQIAAGAADIPLTRLFGVPPKGLGNSGESDMANYYDSIRSAQELDIGPEMQLLDQCLQYSALGKVDPSLHYVWRSLWQTTPKEQADIGKTVADTIKTLSDTKLFPADALAKVGANALVEAQAMPGIEDEMEAAQGSDLPEPEPEATSARVADAAPRSLYVSRKVLNGVQILRHFAEQGVTPVLASDDLHVTIAYSKKPIDWMAVPADWAANHDGRMSIAAGGPRMMDKFGEALVLLFNSWQLSSRHGDIREVGASWDHADYQPHITIAYNGKQSAEGLKPYTGPIELGPEIFEEVQENWSEGKA